MSKRLSITKSLLASALVVALAGCGGGGSSSSATDPGPGDEPQTISGVIDLGPSSGSASIDRITIVSAEGQESAATFDGDGAYSIETPEGGGPYLIYADLSDGRRLFGISTDGVSGNINAITDMIVRKAKPDLFLRPEFLAEFGEFSNLNDSDFSPLFGSYPLFSTDSVDGSSFAISALVNREVLQCYRQGDQNYQRYIAGEFFSEQGAPLLTEGGLLDCLANYAETRGGVFDNTSLIHDEFLPLRWSGVATQVAQNLAQAREQTVFELDSVRIQNFSQSYGQVFNPSTYDFLTDAPTPEFTAFMERINVSRICPVGVPDCTFKIDFFADTEKTIKADVSLFGHSGLVRVAHNKGIPTACVDGVDSRFTRAGVGEWAAQIYTRSFDDFDGPDGIPSPNGKVVNLPPQYAEGDLPICPAMLSAENERITDRSELIANGVTCADVVIGQTMPKTFRYAGANGIGAPNSLSGAGAVTSCSESKLGPGEDAPFAVVIEFERDPGDGAAVEKRMLSFTYYKIPGELF